MSARTVFVLNGPNLNLLGRRDPGTYGTATLADVEQLCRQETARLGLVLDFRQSNHEGVLIDWVQEAFDTDAAIVANFGALTHTSIALRDALEVVSAPVVEVHISDIHAREDFRRHSFISAVADDVVIGEGVAGYARAIRMVHDRWSAGPDGRQDVHVSPGTDENA